MPFLKHNHAGRWCCYAVVITALSLCIGTVGTAQSMRPPKYEVRAVWITTVGGLDWPRSLDPKEQQRSLRAMIDKLARANFNTIYFQIRGRGDALYRSNYEPWSAVLTGSIGKDPGWDPLEFAVREAHERGMEIHAWFNTFLVKNAGGGGKQAVTSRHPDWVHNVGGEWWLDPGIPAARGYTLDVALDIVRRYDIDGFHFDFMRYPQGGYDDDDAFRRYNPHRLPRADWRRNNINTFIAAFHDSAVQLKPRIKVGSAPIGIYHKTNGLNGLQSFDDLYQDSRQWLKDGSQDYIVPQAYWALGRSNGHPDFAMVAKDWSTNTFGRQVILGTAPYKSDVAPQIPKLIDTTRSFGTFAGNSFFRYEHLAPMISVGGRYRYPALIPPMPWKDSIPPMPPLTMRVSDGPGGQFHLAWKEPHPSRDGDRVYRYNIYRSSTQPVDVTDIRNLVESVFATTLTYDDRIEHPTAAKYYYTVTAMDAGNNESGPSVEEAVVVPEIVQMAKKFVPEFRMAAPVPAAVNEYVYFTYEIPEASTVTLGIFDSGDHEVARVVDEFQGSGRHIAAARVEKLAEGEYRYRLTASKGTFKGVFSVER